MESTFSLDKKRLQEEIDSCDVAIGKHKEGLYIHEVVKKAFQDELSKLPEEECISTVSQED
jgi:hypothetical protein